MTKRSESKVTLNITPGELTPAQLTKWNKVWVGSITVYGADQQFTTLSFWIPFCVGVDMLKRNGDADLALFLFRFY